MQYVRRGVAVTSMCSKNNVERNFRTCGELARKAVELGAGLLCFPECFAFMGTTGTKETANFAQSLDGELIQQYQQLARENGLWLSLGGFHEKYDTKSKYLSNIYNVEQVS